MPRLFYWLHRSSGGLTVEPGVGARVKLFVRWKPTAFGPQVGPWPTIPISQQPATKFSANASAAFPNLLCPALCSLTEVLLYYLSQFTFDNPFVCLAPSRPRNSLALSAIVVLRRDKPCLLLCPTTTSSTNIQVSIIPRQGTYSHSPSFLVDLHWGEF